MLMPLRMLAPLRPRQCDSSVTGSSKMFRSLPSPLRSHAGIRRLLSPAISMANITPAHPLRAVTVKSVI